MTTRRGSILLNSPAQSPALVSQHLPSYPASTLSTVSSAESSDMHIYRSASVPTPTRRIRFAPLPETIIDIPTRTESPQSVPTPSSLTPCPSITSISKQKSKSTFLRQINIFKRSSLSSQSDPSPSPSSSPRFSTEDVLTLGTYRFLRRPRTPDLGPSLSRVSSAREPKRPSTAPDIKSRSSINSLGSGGGRHAMPPKSFVNSPPSSPTAHHTVPKKSGMRMLNGRVYGSKRNNSINANPFANVRDEPEFVEWGYGGMGSVKGSSDSKYSVLATGTPALLSHTQTQKVVIGGGRGAVGRVSVETVARAVEDDDGSGMGWVRKRREERERLAREKEDQARHTSAEARHSGEINRSSFDSPTLDTDSRCTSTDGSSALDTDLSTLAASSAPTTPPSTTDTLPEDEQEKHITQAVRLSPKHTRHHLSHLRQLGAHSPENQDLVVGTTIGRLESDKNDQSPTSEISSDTDGEDDTLKDDDESEIEQTEDQRKTSLGAGVEKISRHKELVHKDSDR